ncbi:MAG: ABC transporter permease [Thermoanaerobaculales bacterium]
MVALAIVRRDLVRYLRNPVRTTLLFALPLVMAAIFALVFGGGGIDDITIKILLFDEDDSLLSHLIEGAAGSSQADQRLEIVPVGEEGYEMMEDGAASALIHLPKGFTTNFLDGDPVTIDVVKNPAERFLPKAVEEGVGIGAVVLSGGSRIFRPELELIAGLRRDSNFPEDLAVAGLSTNVNRKIRELKRFLFPPIIDLETVALTDEAAVESSNTAGVLSFFLPGLSIMGILFLAQSATRDILRDREAGLLRHLLTAPVSPTDYLVGKCLSVLLVTGLGFGILVGVGIAAGVDWGPPVAVVVLVLASAIAASGLLLLIMSLVGSERQGDALTTIVIIVSSMLGGAFMPIGMMPSFMKTISSTTIVYWSTTGFTKLMAHGGELADIVPNLLVLVSSGGALMLLGAFLLKRKMAKGVL